MSAGRKGGRSPQKHSTHVESPEEQRHGKKSTGAKSLRAMSMSVISKSHSDEVKTSAQDACSTTSLVPEASSSSSSVALQSDCLSQISGSTSDPVPCSDPTHLHSNPVTTSSERYPHRRTSAGSRTAQKKTSSAGVQESVKLEEKEDTETAPTDGVPSDILEKVGSVPLGQPDAPGSGIIPDGGGKATQGEIGKVMKQEDVSGTTSQKSPGQLEKQLGVEQVMEVSTTGESLLEEAEREAVKHLKPKSKRGRKPGSGKRSKLAKSLKPYVERAPGTSLKVCNNCGTVSEKSKAKKCHKCKKFFFDHWAKRCKIPPCPKCHFSRKARQSERIPANCDRCGHPLPLPNVTSATTDAEYLEEEEGEEEEESMEFESASITSNETSTTGTNSISEAPLSGEMMTDREGRLKRVTEFGLEVEPQVGSGGDGQKTSEKSKSPEAKDIIPTLESVTASECGLGMDKSVKAIPSTPGSSHTGHGEQTPVVNNPGATPQPSVKIPSVTPPNQTALSAPSSISPISESIAITRSGKVYKQDAVQDTVLKVLETQQAVLAAATKSLASKVLGTTSPKISFPSSHPHLQFPSSAAHQTVYAPVYTPINTFTAKASGASTDKASGSSTDKASSPSNSDVSLQSLDKEKKTEQTSQSSSPQPVDANLDLKGSSATMHNQTTPLTTTPAGTKDTTSIATDVSDQATAVSIQQQSDCSTQTTSGLPKTTPELPQSKSQFPQVTSQTTSGLPQTKFGLPKTTSVLSQTSSGLPQITSGLPPKISFPSSHPHLQFPSSAAHQTVYAPVYTPINTFTAKASGASTDKASGSSTDKASSPSNSDVSLQSLDKEKKTEQTSQSSSPQPVDANLDLKGSSATMHNQTTPLTTTPAGTKDTTSIATDVSDQATAVSIQQQSDCSTQTTSGLPKTTPELPQSKSQFPQVTSQTTSGLPQTKFGLPKTTSVLSQTSSGLPQITSGLPQSSSKLPQITSVLPQSSSELPQTTSGLPQVKS